MALLCAHARVGTLKANGFKSLSIRTAFPGGSQSLQIKSSSVLSRTQLKNHTTTVKSLPPLKLKEYLKFSIPVPRIVAKLPIPAATRTRLMRTNWYQGYERRSGYERPSFFDTVDSETNLVYLIILINVLIWLAWNTWGSNRSGLITMFKNFTVSLDNLNHGRIHTLLTSVFSQASFMHLFSNMLTLYFFAPEVAAHTGTRKFLGLYLGAGLMGSLTHVWWSSVQGKNAPALGASGAVNAVTVVFALLNPYRTVYFLPFVPTPAWVATLVFLGRDFIGLGSSSSHVGHAAHLGGAAFGAGFYFLFM